jgi:hypothetical protein
MDYARFFLEPRNSTHRQYEALRAFFVDRQASAEVARRFGYTPGSFRVLCCEFRQDPERAFFLAPERGPGPTPGPTARRQLIVTLRKQNLSIYDIEAALEERGQRLSAVAISQVLKEEGFARLPRRGDEERPGRPRVEPAPAADARLLDLTPRDFRTAFGGLFLFVPHLVRIPLERMLGEAGFPGTEQIPAGPAWRSLLGLKLFGQARHSHVMSAVFDPGLGLWAGLNVIPKRSFLTEYSCRIDPAAYPPLMRSWLDQVSRLGLEWGDSFDLDFHTIPFHGEDALLQEHYVSKRSRRQKGVLAFVAQDALTRVFCYAQAGVRKEEQNHEVLRFVQFWKERTGRLPQELIFDSRLTTYANLSRLNTLGIHFMTLRRRSEKLLRELHAAPVSAWRRVQLEGVGRAYRNPRVLDQEIRLPDYDGLIRQLTIDELGHEQPTLLLTNQLRRSPAKLITRYAQRMVIENNLANGIEFFHIDALSSAVPLKTHCDLQLTLMASSLYHLLAARIGHGYTTAKSSHLFRDFINASAHIAITESHILVRFQKRAHNPLLMAAGFHEEEVRIPWLGNKKLRFLFG